MCDIALYYGCEGCDKRENHYGEFKTLYKLEYANNRSSENIHDLFGKKLCNECFSKEYKNDKATK